MQKYKVIASKSQKKYTFVVRTKNEKLARERVHNDGYSILSVEIFNEGSISKNIFIFEAEYKGKIKKGKIVGDDILKNYIQLVDGVGYNIFKLYHISDENKSEEYKENFLNDIKEQYFYYKKLNKKGKDEKVEKNKLGKNEINVDNFYLKKELDETYRLIDFALEKLKKILENNRYDLTEERKDKLKNLYNSLIKIKSSTNISKLKKVGEAVLLKIGQIELENLEKFKDNNSKKYLDETNKLLKQIGSNEKIIPENRDIKKQLEKIIVFIKSFFKNYNNKKILKKDKTSSSYLKNLIFLNKYKQKLKQNNKDILKKFYLFLLPISKFEEEKQNILLKRSVIKQNIYLFKAKIEGKVFSYTKTLKGFQFILESILNFFSYIKDYLFYVVLFYSLLFLIFLNFTYYNILSELSLSLNYNGIFYFIMFIFVYFAIYFSRGIYSLILNFIILFFIFNFGIINF